MRPLFPEKLNRGTTLTEVVTVAAIVISLAAILLPVTGLLLSNARAAKCTSNLRQFFVVFQSYATDHGNRLPPWRAVVQREDGTSTGGASWRALLEPYMPGVQLENRTNHRTIDVCPAEKPYQQAVYNFYYGMNTDSNANEQRNWSAITHPGRYFLLGDSSGVMRISYASSAQDLAFRHRDRANLLFLDGHAESRPVEAIPPYNQRGTLDFKEFWSGGG